LFRIFEVFIKITRLLENIFREIEVLLNLFEAFIKIIKFLKKFAGKQSPFLRNAVLL
jgi:hypothetical protein